MKSSSYLSEFEKEEKYIYFLTQANALLEGETDLIANLSNLSALLKNAFNFWWCGFYFFNGKELILGPFQGPVACTRIQVGKGVCGKSWALQQSILVNDVHQFPGHIACSEISESELVVPYRLNNNPAGVIDIDSEFKFHFTDTDKKYIEKLAELINIKCQTN